MLSFEHKPFTLRYRRNYMLNLWARIENEKNPMIQEAMLSNYATKQSLGWETH